MPIFIRTAGMWIVAAIGLLAAMPSPAAGVEYDTIIRNGHIIDGTGSPWYAADISVKDGRIAAIGNLADAHARRVIDAHGLVVAPGFIDMLGQSEITLLVDPHVPSKIFQGITTEITGEGESVAPLDAGMIEQRQATYAHYGITPDWRTLEQYFARLQKQGMGINVGTYVGATSVREMVMGYENRAPTPDELKKMQTLVADAMKQGALGLSTALEYTPAPYAGTDELIALAKVAARHGGIYATHMRNEGDAEMAALDETFRIGREADIPVEIFHLKATGNLKGRMAQVIARIDAARASGIDVAADTYAYTAWQNDLSAFIPPWAHDGGKLKLIERLKNPATRARIRKDMLTPSDTWDNEWLAAIGQAHGIMIGSVTDKALQKYVGKRVSEIAAEWHEDPIDTICDFLIKDNAATSSVVFGMQESDVELALKQPWVSIDTDYEGTSPDGLLGKDRPHPRAYGTFPRILARYAREQKLLALPDAIRKFSALAAQREHLTDRGVLKQGMWADIVVFDPDTIRDVATFTDPNRLSVGMQYVLVNGVPVIAGGKMTDALPGVVLHGPAYSGK